MSASTHAAAAAAAAAAAESLTRLREAEPLVHCLTNQVVSGVTANVLLALGATPAMVDVPGEAGPFAGVADAVLVNLGTPDTEQREAMLEAVAVAHEAGRPWVLDPVAVGFLPVRTALAARLVDLRPSVVRGNASEVLAVAGAGAGGRGVDAVDDVESAVEAATRLARHTGGAVTVSGAVDLVTDGHRSLRVANGDPLLTRMTGGGCALGAVVAAFLAVEPGPVDATVAALLTYTIAAEQAAAAARGPGSFAVALLDELAAITPDDVVRHSRLS